MELKRVRVSVLIFLYVLLIVPYGIETIQLADSTGSRYSFNRTLWN